MPNRSRRTRYGEARRRPDGWVWLCDYCATAVTLGMMPDLTVDPDRWLAAIDAAHRCEHKPTDGEEPNT